MVAHFVGEVGEVEVGGDERGWVVDGRCEPRSESSDEREALGSGAAWVQDC